MKTSKQDQNQLMEMIDYIQNNANPVSHQVPDTILNLWIEKTDDSQYTQKECFTFFIKLFMLQKASTGVTSLEFEEKHTYKTFHTWVMHINMEGLRRKGLIELESFNIFDFETLLSRQSISIVPTEKFKKEFL